MQRREKGMGSIYQRSKRDIPVNPVALVEMPHESNFEKKEIRFFTKAEPILPGNPAGVHLCCHRMLWTDLLLDYAGMPGTAGNTRQAYCETYCFHTRSQLRTINRGQFPENE